MTDLISRSHDIIAANQPSGAYLASPSFSAYQGYCWLRDGSFIAEGMSRLDPDSASAFHDWVQRVLIGRAEQVRQLLAMSQAGQIPAAADMLPTRFTIDGRDGQDEWWDFQTDGYGAWLWAVATHAKRHDLDLERWRAGIEIAASYVAEFWPLPCYDWWEEHVEFRHISTLGALFGGLTAIVGSALLDGEQTERAEAAAGDIRQFVATFGVVNERGDGSTGSPTPYPHLTKWVGNPRLDASLAACIVPFGLYGPTTKVGMGTIDAIAAELDVDGGVHRFTADVFYGGGQWPLLSCLLGWNRAAQGDDHAARRYLEWAGAQANTAGELPEQSATHLLHPQDREQWVGKWGPVATPLLWSHGMYLILADEITQEK